MIFIKNDPIYAKVWSVERKEKYSEVRLSTSEKKRDSNEYINSNWSFVRFIGHAHNKDLAEGDRIVIRQAKLSNEPYKDKEGKTRSAFRFVVLDFDKQDAANTPTKAKAVSATTEAVAEDDDELPY